MIRCALFSLCLICASFSTWADTLKSEPEAKQLAEKVMAQAAKGNISGAFNVMKPYVAIPDSEFEGLSLQSKAQRDQFGSRFGKSIGYEFVSEKKVGQSVLRFVYIEKTEKHALPWMFVFYKTPGGWTLNSFVWNDKIQNVFE